MDFSQNTLDGIAGRLRASVGVLARVRFAYRSRGVDRDGHLAFDGDTLRLSEAPAPHPDVPTVNLAIPRARIRQALRDGANKLELRIDADPDAPGIEHLRAIESEDTKLIDRLVTWVPDAATRFNWVQHWYAVNLGAYRRQAWATYALAAALIAVFVWQGLHLGRWQFDPRALTELGANLPARTLGGEPWRLLTSLFLHADFGHLLGNLIVIVVLLPYVERLYRPWGMLALFIASGLAGTVADIWTNFTSAAVGASGGVFGLLGALLAYAVRRRAQLPLRAIRAILIVGGSYLCWQMFEGFRSVVINNSAHVAGFACGLVLGALIAPPLERNDGRAWNLAAYAALLFAGVGAIWSLPLARAESGNWHLVQRLQAVRRDVGEIDARCKTAVNAARVDPGGSHEDFAAACVRPLGVLIEELRDTRPEDQELSLEIADRVAKLEYQYRANRDLERTLRDLGALSRAESTREHALAACDEVLEAVDNEAPRALVTRLREDCLPPLRQALDLLTQARPATPEYVEYAHAAGMLWQAETSGFALLADALNAGDSARAAQAVREIETARDHFATATGRAADPEAPEDDDERVPVNVD